MKPIIVNRLLFICFLLILPFALSAQITIKGGVLNQADTKPVPNATVFLTNASVGGKTGDDGTFTLTNVKPGKYDLVVSIVGFDAYKKTVTAGNNDINAGDITIFPKTVDLKEVKIVAKETDPFRERNFNWFKDEFLGKSERAKECKIINPELLDLNYDDRTKKLTASSVDFLIVENRALGYRLKYLISNFVRDNSNEDAIKIHYEGNVLFESLKGTPADEKKWQRERLDIYENSPMHFLRALLNKSIDEDGFRVFKYTAKHGEEKSAMEVAAAPSTNKELIDSTDQKGIYILGVGSAALNVTYSKNHRFSSKPQTAHLNDAYNKDVTVIVFNTPVVFFDNNGTFTNPSSVSFDGAWGKYRAAELLPVDYDPSPNKGTLTQADLSIKNIGEKLQGYQEAHIREKAYLHLDKPFYAAGDTIYYKAYVTAGERHELSQQSGILHVELISPKGRIAWSLLTRLTNGMGWGDIALPDTLLKGNYRLRAYTNWMRNEDTGAFFERSVPVGAIQKDNVPESTAQLSPQTTNTAPDFQFFPEGGNLVAGVKSKVAFKAVGPDGLGINIKGSITDNTGRPVVQFESTHAGMGYFYIEPEAGRTYKANVVFDGRTQSSFNLPAALPNSTVLTVKSLPGIISVTLTSTKDFLSANLNKDYSLLFYSGGVASAITVKLDSLEKTVSMPNKRMFTGINRVTLFAPNGEPLSERLFFIQNHDQLNLSVNSDKKNYASREKVTVKLNATDRAGAAGTGHFSVSVTDESKVQADENTENTILSALLVTSELKGNIEDPGYYFANNSDERLKDLDLIMLTHGYRNFEWKKVLYGNKPVMAYQPENSLGIDGVIKTFNGKPMPNVPVSLVSFGSGLFLTQQTDDKGNFKFPNLDFADSTRFLLQATNASGKNKADIVYKMPLAPPVSPVINPVGSNADMRLEVYLQNTLEQNHDYIKFGGPRGIMLKQVDIKNVKAKNDYNSSNLGGSGHADQVLHMADVPQGGRLSDILGGRLLGVKFADRGAGMTAQYGSASSFMNSDMLIVVDGIPMNASAYPPFDINSLNSFDIETVEVLKYGNSATYGVRGGFGVLVFTTKQIKRGAYKNIAAEGVLPIAAKGYYKARTFYSPKYDNAKINAAAAKIRDLRTTIYWNPDLPVDKDGKAAVDFYNADSPGKYRVVIEGMDENGNLGRQVYRYEVK